MTLPDEDDGFIPPVLMPFEPNCNQQSAHTTPLRQQSPLDRIWAESKAAAEREQQAREAYEQGPFVDMMRDAQVNKAKAAKLREMLNKYERPEPAGAPTNDLKANPGAHTHTPLDSILAARGERYGAFMDNAYIAQGLKTEMHGGKSKWFELNWDQREALDQIAAKISRILVGDPDYVDNWDDIAGYAKLVADRLRS